MRRRLGADPDRSAPECTNIGASVPRRLRSFGNRGRLAGRRRRGAGAGVEAEAGFGGWIEGEGRCRSRSRPGTSRISSIRLTSDERAVAVDDLLMARRSADIVGNRVVLTDTAVLETMKTADWEHSLRRSFKIISKYPNRIWLAKAPGVLIRDEVASIPIERWPSDCQNPGRSSRRAKRPTAITAKSRAEHRHTTSRLRCRQNITQNPGIPK